MKKLLISAGLILLLVIGWVMAISNGMPKAADKAQVASYLEFASSQRELGAYGSAISNYNAALKVMDSAEIRHLLADTYLEAEKESEYQDELERIISKYPKDTAAYDKLGGFYFSKSNYSDCVEVSLEAHKNGCLSDELKEKYFDALYHYTVVSSAFDEAGDFYTSSALVKVEDTYRYVTSGMDYTLGEYSWADNALSTVVGVIDEEGTAGFLATSGLKYVDGEQKYEKVYSYSENLAVVMRDGQYYYVNSRYKEVFGPFEAATHFAGGVAAVKENGSWHLIDLGGNKVGDQTFSDVIVNEDNFCSYGGVVFAGNGQGYDMYGTDGKLIKQCGFADARPFFTGNYTAVKVGDQWGFVDKSGNMILEAQYEDAKPFGNEIAAVKLDGLWGYVTAQGRVVIDPVFADAGCFAATKIAPVKIEDAWVYIQLED